jgi:hypothetical protein
LKQLKKYGFSRGPKRYRFHVGCRLKITADQNFR